ncbi:transcription factor HHO6-like [Typha latifolia]|uniref:transcription factor HHO6-like n=1 Tax=Typha latifolia TaxID=4733 RepID=UPI003C302DC6
MGSLVPEMGSDLKLSTMRTIKGFLKEALAIKDGEGKVTKLEECVKSLEVERGKIEVFKRELPLCMHLLGDVIDGLREELEQCRSEPYLEEFVPTMKGKFEEEGGVEAEKDCRDKMEWMSSVQLWTDTCSNTNNNDDEERGIEKENPLLRSESPGNSDVSAAVAESSKKEEKAMAALADLSLLTPRIESSWHVQSQQKHQTQRKTRRCWSPELHQKFIGVLHQLGGAQVATPKQIRELMKVDDLTNDEVKSHLQKYRLHTRRTPNSSAPVNGTGGLWFNQEQQTSSQSASPQGPLQLANSRRAVSATAGDSYEEEDAKSESYSFTTMQMRKRDGNQETASRLMRP